METYSDNAFAVPIEKFQLENKKDEINSYMIGKILRKKYESLGYKVMQTQDFETSLLIGFVRKYRFLDKYIKVKLGEYKRNLKILEYNKEILALLGEENTEKLLFVCRICSYLGDPSFPDFIISGNGKTELRYVYTGDELVRSKIFFILLSKILGIQIKFCSTDFSDFKNKENIEADFKKTLGEINKSFSLRINLETSFDDVGIDFNLFKSWEAKIGQKDMELAYGLFKKKISSDKKLDGLLDRMKNIDRKSFDEKPKPEQLTALRNTLGINMLEANELLVLMEILK